MKNNWKISLQTWVYDLAEIQWKEFIIENKSKVILFDSSNRSQDFHIELMEESILEFYKITDSDSKSAINIFSLWKKSKSKINILNLSRNSQISLVLDSTINYSECASNIHILSFCWNYWNVSVNSWINITKDWKDSIGDILQENIFIWENWKIVWIPSLDIQTSEAKASHGLKIEKIKEEDLFYLGSRWIDKTMATDIILESKINNLFKDLSMNHLSFFENKLKDFLNNK